MIDGAYSPALYRAVLDDAEKKANHAAITSLGISLLLIIPAIFQPAFQRYVDTIGKKPDGDGQSLFLPAQDLLQNGMGVLGMVLLVFAAGIYYRSRIASVALALIAFASFVGVLALLFSMYDTGGSGSMAKSFAGMFIMSVIFNAVAIRGAIGCFEFQSYNAEAENKQSGWL